MKNNDFSSDVQFFNGGTEICSNGTICKLITPTFCTKETPKGWWCYDTNNPSQGFYAHHAKLIFLDLDPIQSSAFLRTRKKLWCVDNFNGITTGKGNYFIINHLGYLISGRQSSKKHLSKTEKDTLHNMLKLLKKLTKTETQYAEIISEWDINE